MTQSTTTTISADPWKLNTAWSIWFHRPLHAVNQDYLRSRICLNENQSIRTIHDFWLFMNHVIPPSKLNDTHQEGYSWFRAGELPDYENPNNHAKMVIRYHVRSTPQQIDSIWQNLVLACVGETIGNHEQYRACEMLVDKTVTAIPMDCTFPRDGFSSTVYSDKESSSTCVNGDPDAFYKYHQQQQQQHAMVEHCSDWIQGCKIVRRYGSYRCEIWLRVLHEDKWADVQQQIQNDILRHIWIRDCYVEKAPCFVERFKKNLPLDSVPAALAVTVAASTPNPNIHPSTPHDGDRGNSCTNKNYHATIGSPVCNTFVSSSTDTTTAVTHKTMIHDSDRNNLQTTVSNGTHTIQSATSANVSHTDTANVAGNDRLALHEDITNNRRKHAIHHSHHRVTTYRNNSDHTPMDTKDRHNRNHTHPNRSSTHGKMTHVIRHRHISKDISADSSLLSKCLPYCTASDTTTTIATTGTNNTLCSRHSRRQGQSWNSKSKHI